jgi:hypothetical protein
MKTLIALAALALAACGGESERSQPMESQAPPDPSVFDPLTGTLERAEGVEDTLREAAEERRRQLDGQEGR